MITSEVEECSTTIEITIHTDDLGVGETDVCWTELTGEYCDSDSGTVDEVWVRVRWRDGAWTDWYSLLNREERVLADSSLDEGFDFSRGSNMTAFLPLVRHVGGLPDAVEYYVGGEDSWRPHSIAVRVPEGLEAGGGGLFFATRGFLCWVGEGGQAVSQVTLGCPYVGQSAVATLHETFANVTQSDVSQSDVSVGLFRAHGSPHSARALRHEDVMHVWG